MLDLVPIAILGIVLSAGVFIQSAAGFAAGLFIVPAMMVAGYSIPEAQTSLLVATIPQNLWGVWKFRDHVSREDLVLPAFLRLVCLPIGMACLAKVDALPPERMRQGIGVLVLAMTVLLMSGAPKTTREIHVGWTWVAFSFSGFFQGVCGMGGPLMVLWVQTHAWDTLKARGFLFSMYLASLFPAMLCLWLFFGSRIVQPALVTVCLTPVLFVATGLGLRLGTWLGKDRLRTITFGLLILTGLSGVLAPWMSLSTLWSK